PPPPPPPPPSGGPPPPPPPPSGGPPPPPPLASSEIPKLRKEDQKARNALLADIQQGTRLRKVTQINDRSAPQIEKPKGANRDGVNPAVNKGGSQQPLGGLFAGGFPVLRPAGQRDMTGGKPGQLSGVRAAAPRPSAPPSSGAAKANSNPSHPAEAPRAALPPEPPDTSRAAAGTGAGPGRPSLPAPPPPPPAASKPSLTFPPPPPVPPPADRPAKLSFPPSPALSGADVPPPLPPKSPHLLSQFHKPSNIQSLPLPPTPGPPQPAAVVETRKKRPGRGAGTGAGKLVTPPQPPARSPTTELTSKSGVSAWATAHDPYTPLKNGNMHIIG
ncbi:WIPF3 protein, partial [Machaerirhynchus nigripectus]|nr:WIPF3 protein [Machaerirhynchus nigripectus]